MKDKMLADPTDRAKVLFFSNSSANKQFFKTGKAQAFLVLCDKLRYQEMV
mgnify:CR=1